MNTLSVFRTTLRLGCAAALVLATVSSPAQTSGRTVRPVTQPAAPAMPAPGITPFGAPNPAGLPSQFPAGLPTPVSPTASPATTVTPLTSPAAVNVFPTDTNVAPQTNVMGAAGYGAAAGAPSRAAAAGAYTPLDIAKSFFDADVNHDGELTRAEGMRLRIAPYSFEEMDRNHDGVVTRFEYEDAVR